MTMDAASTVAELACLTESRSKAEHQALVAVAERVDRERNRQSARNPRLDGRPLGPCAPRRLRQEVRVLWGGDRHRTERRLVVAERLTLVGQPNSWLEEGDDLRVLRLRLRRARRIVRGVRRVGHRPSWHDGFWTTNNSDFVKRVRDRWWIVEWRQDGWTRQVRICKRCGHWLHGSAWGTVWLANDAAGRHEAVCWDGRLPMEGGT